jgi:hypothetical protein
VKSHSAEVEAQLASGRLRRRLAVRFDLPSGRYGFITGYRGNISYGETLYVGSGGLIEVSQPEAKMSAEATEVTVSLASHRRINGEIVQVFEPHLLDTIEDEVWFMQPAVVQRFWFNAGRQLVDVEQLHLRAIFSIEHKKARTGRRIEGRLMAPSAFAKVFEAKPNGPDLQKQVDATDTSYDDILTALTDAIYWGREDPKSKPSNGNKR